MLLPPADIVALMDSFAPLFSRRVWRHIPLLVVGTILAPGRRMMSSVLRTVGLSQERHFQTYHRVREQRRLAEPERQPHSAASARARVRAEWTAGAGH